MIMFRNLLKIFTFCISQEDSESGLINRENEQLLDLMKTL